MRLKQLFLSLLKALLRFALKLFLLAAWILCSLTAHITQALADYLKKQLAVK